MQAACLTRWATIEDLPEIEAILDHPEVRPHFRDFTVQDVPLRDAFAEGDISIVLFDGGLFVLDLSSERTVRVHVAALPEARGTCALEAAREAAALLFAAGFETIEGWTPTDHRAAIMFNRVLGFGTVGTDQGRALYAANKETFRWHS